MAHNILHDIEALRLSALNLNDAIKNIFLVIVSNLLRDYSLQEPSDLRIRRRYSPFPETSIIIQVKAAIDHFNNLDFRLGTGKLRYTKIAEAGDLAAITRISEYSYELRIIKPESDAYTHLIPHAVTFIGHQGKKYGYISNAEFTKVI